MSGIMTVLAPSLNITRLRHIWLGMRNSDSRNAGVKVPCLNHLANPHGPSSAVRTRGLLLPKQARYQLRYTRIYTKCILIDILPTAKAGGFLHQPPLRSLPKRTDSHQYTYIYLTVALRLLKIFRSFTTFNSRYTNNMPKFFATNLHFPAAIEFALVSLYVVAFPSLEPTTPCIT